MLACKRCKVLQSIVMIWVNCVRFNIAADDAQSPDLGIVGVWAWHTIGLNIWNQESGILYFSTQQKHEIMKASKHSSQWYSNHLSNIHNKQGRQNVHQIQLAVTIKTPERQTHPSPTARDGVKTTAPGAANGEKAANTTTRPHSMFSDTFYKHTNLMQFNRIYSTHPVN